MAVAPTAPDLVRVDDTILPVKNDSFWARQRGAALQPESNPFTTRVPEADTLPWGAEVFRMLVQQAASDITVVPATPIGSVQIPAPSGSGQALVESAREMTEATRTPKHLAASDTTEAQSSPHDASWPRHALADSFPTATEATWTPKHLAASGIATAPVTEPARASRRQAAGEPRHALDESLSVATEVTPTPEVQVAVGTSAAVEILEPSAASEVASAPESQPRRALRRRKSTTKKRLLGSASFVLVIVAVFFLVTGVTSARYGATKPSTASTFSSGTVTLANSAITTCPVSNLFPTGTASAACTFTATYSGSVPAYLATNVVIETQAGSGGTRLYNPTDSSNDLQITITSTTPTVSYTVPTTATTCSGAPVGSLCYELDNELISTLAQSSATVGFSFTFKLPTSSTTGYQGGAAQVILTTHAVQSGNNALSCTTTPTAGSPCTPSGSFKWS
jgi:hypothetical protein